MMRLAAVLLGTVLCVADASAQVSARRIAVGGTIIDADTGVPLAYASITLEPAPAGALPGGASAALRQTRVALTDTTGRYRFDNVAHGDYRLHVQRTGYRSRSVDVRVRPESDAHVSVGLQVEPVLLEAVSVAAAPAPNTVDTYARRAREDDDVLIANALRTAAERLRQREYLSSDVRVITHADIVEGMSLGETDLFRSLQRLPGVNALDEWSAELLTRGAPWDQTRIYFDGLPLFNSLHAAGLFAAVNADAIGAAFLHPGIQPAALAGAAAGSLDIRSRAGSSTGSVAGLGEISLASARIALDRRSTNASNAWMIAARRSYLDLVTRALEPIAGEEAAVPYAFYDIAARGDWQLGSTTSLEVSGLLARDNAYGEVADVLESTRAKWGGGIARATIAAPVGSLHTRHTVGYSGYASRVRDVPPRDEFSVARARAARNRLHYGVLRGELLPLHASSWSGGYEIARYTVSYNGRAPHSTDLPELVDSLRYASDMNIAAAWLQRRVTLGEAFVAELGMRAEGGARVQRRGVFALAPRLSVRVQLGSQLTASAAIGRTWQYMQAITPAGVSPVRGFASDFLWLVADDTIPALRADVATAGLERWIGDSWIVAMNGYLRHGTGMTVPDPRAGDLVDRPLFVSAENDAQGVELSLRRLTGRWTGSAAYTYGRSIIRHDTLEFASPYEQRHALDVTLAGRLGRNWLIGLAYMGASGTPFTRRWEGSVLCLEEDCRLDQPARQEAPSAHRRRAYHSLDTNVEWTRRYTSWRLTAFLQVRNVLNRDNEGRYVNTAEICWANCGGPNEQSVIEDEFLPALPLLPLLGVRVSF